LALSEALRPGVVQIAVGAWYDPAPGDPSFCRHGNPNVLTADRPSSNLTPGHDAQHALVEVELWSGEVPDVAVTEHPVLVPISPA
jgi:biotin/methionine sulfoxide reductase